MEKINITEGGLGIENTKRSEPKEIQRSGDTFVKNKTGWGHFLENKEILEKKTEIEKVYDQKDVSEKVEQSIRILSTLWDKRLSVINDYYKTRNKKRFIPFKSESSVQEEAGELLSGLSEINNREVHVLNILKQGAFLGNEILQNNFVLTPEKEEVPSEIKDFNEKISSVKNIIKRYSELISSHEDILKIERELLESPNEEKMELYLKRMEMFGLEFKIVDSKEVEGLKKYLSEIEIDLKKIEEARKQGKPLIHLEQSMVSAVVRVAVANLIAGVVVGNPFDNPLFWSLTAATVPSVLAVNYVDYYFKVFTKITQKITSRSK